MPHAYPKQLREQIVRKVMSGVSRRTTAQLFDVSLAFVVKLMQRWSRDGTLQPKRLNAYLLAEHGRLVRTLIATQPDGTIVDLHKRLAAAGLRLSCASVRRYLIAEGLDRKSRRSLHLGADAQPLRPPVPPTRMVAPL